MCVCEWGVCSSTLEDHLGIAQKARLRARSGCHFHHSFDRMFILVVVKLEVSAALSPRQMQLFLVAQRFSWAAASLSSFLPSVKTRIQVSFMATKTQRSLPPHQLGVPLGCSSTVTTGVSSGSPRPSKVTGCSPPWTTSPHPTPTVHLKAPLGDLSCSFTWMWKRPQNPDPGA